MMPVSIGTRPGTVNVAARLIAVARQMPDAVAVAEPRARDRRGKRAYRCVSFRELDQDSDRVAEGLVEMGVVPGTRLALLIRPGVEFILLVFALLKAGAVVVLIDPGMGRRNLIRCLGEVEPEGFVAIPPVQAVRALLRRRFAKSRFHVTVGRRWFWGGVTLEALLHRPWNGSFLASTGPDDPAAIIFTTGSTGPPKGVLYRHEILDSQTEQIQHFYDIRPGEIDLPCFPMFGLFNCAMGVTAVIPDMDPSRPARVDPANLVEAIRDWQVTQAFGSPAVWDRLGRYCREQGIRLGSVRRVLSAGAPVPAGVLQTMKRCIHPEGEIHTPYGATESLPVASIASGEVLGETAARTAEGAGVCVGRRFPGVQWRVVRIVDGPLATIAEAEVLPTGHVGELIVRGPAVSHRYVTRTEWNALTKIADPPGLWHRMGDVGYLDEHDRFWYCGRMSHRVETSQGPLYTAPCEAIFNRHPDVRRTALVGVGPRGSQRPVIVVEPLPGRMPKSASQRAKLLDELRELANNNPGTAAIRDFLLHRAFPVDIRHNTKIFREKLAVWAQRKLGR